MIESSIATSLFERSARRIRCQEHGHGELRSWRHAFLVVIAGMAAAMERAAVTTTAIEGAGVARAVEGARLAVGAMERAGAVERTGLAAGAVERARVVERTVVADHATSSVERALTIDSTVTSME